MFASHFSVRQVATGMGLVGMTNALSSAFCLLPLGKAVIDPSRPEFLSVNSLASALTLWGGH
jgi:hypothetical protein